MPYASDDDRRSAQMRHYYRNHEREKAKHRARYHANIEASRAMGRADMARTRARKRINAGIDVAAMLVAQGGRCAICRTGVPGKLGWCLDHCHKTGKVRGLLCTKCNTGIGMLRDDPVLCEFAAFYLRSNK